MHIFASSVEVFEAGIDDVTLINAMHSEGFECLITRDGAQLDNAHERDALYQSGIHWVGHRGLKAKGVELFSTLTSTYALAMPEVLRTLEHAASPMAIKVFHAAKRGHDIVRSREIVPGKNPFK